MAVNCSPFGPAPQFSTSTGGLASGWQLFFYVGGSVGTKQNTYTDSTGNVANPNPSLLSIEGRPTTAQGALTQLWFTAGQTYKVVIAPPTDTDPPASGILLGDFLAGINDISNAASEWQAGPAPTFISGTQFTLVGDQTVNFTVGRRCRFTVTAGTIYGTITASVYTTLTTVTVALDSGALDSGLSAVSYALLASTNPSLPIRGVISPAQFTVNQNNLTLANFANASAVRFSTNARLNITGLAGGQDGKMAVFHNVGTFPGVFTYQDALSTAANRFAFGLTLGGGQSCELVYDNASAIWRLKAQPDAPVGTIRDFGGGTVPGGNLGCDASAQSRTTYAALFNEIGTTWGVGDGSTTFNLPPPARVYIGSGTAVTAETITSQLAAGNAIPVASNNTKWITGMPVTVSGVSGFVGLTNGAWWIVRLANNSVQFATSLANAQNGTVATITGTGNAVLTTTFTVRTLGEIGGEEAHAQAIAELLAHIHTDSGHLHAGGWSTAGGGATSGSGTQPANTAIASAVITSTGGNAAMNIMQVFAVVTKMIKF
jgi:microcystin-dependent protein